MSRGQEQLDARLVEVVLDDSAAVRHGPDEEHERRIAIFDLVEDNFFAPRGAIEGGPYRLRVSRIEARLVLHVEEVSGEAVVSTTVSLGSLRRVLRDYETICASYHEAIKSGGRAQIEAIDMGRRGLHNDGSEILRDALADKVEVDEDTARRMFTLIYALHAKV